MPKGKAAIGHEPLQNAGAAFDHLGRKSCEVFGDAGFANDANLAPPKRRRITAYLAPDRARHGEADAAMRRELAKTLLMRTMGRPAAAGWPPEPLPDQ